MNTLPHWADLVFPELTEQACDRCDQARRASDESLRVQGWLVYDGASWNGQPMRVRICVSCQQSAKDEQRPRPRPAYQAPLFQWHQQKPGPWSPDRPWWA